MADLASSEVQRILTGCGLAEVSARLAVYQSSRVVDIDGTPATDPALSLPKIAEAMRTFFGKLSDPAALPEFRKVHAPLLKAEAVQRSLVALADSYASVYEQITSPESGYVQSEVNAAVRHTPDKVRTLLGVS